MHVLPRRLSGRSHLVHTGVALLLMVPGDGSGTETGLSHVLELQFCNVPCTPSIPRGSFPERKPVKSIIQSLHSQGLCPQQIPMCDGECASSFTQEAG